MSSFRLIVLVIGMKANKQVLMENYIIFGRLPKNSKFSWKKNRRLFLGQKL
jgi:hypothetical protein